MFNLVSRLRPLAQISKSRGGYLLPQLQHAIRLSSTVTDVKTDEKAKVVVKKKTMFDEALEKFGKSGLFVIGAGIMTFMHHCDALIVDEEALVAVAFIIFACTFRNYFGDTIRDVIAAPRDEFLAKCYARLKAKKLNFEVMEERLNETFTKRPAAKLINEINVDISNLEIEVKNLQAKRDAYNLMKIKLDNISRLEDKIIADKAKKLTLSIEKAVIQKFSNMKEDPNDLNDCVGTLAKLKF